MNLPARAQALVERINGLSLRERGLLFLAILAGLFLIWDLAVMQPIDDRRESTQDQREQVRDRVTQLSHSIQELAAERGRDPDAELEARREELEQDIGQLERQIRELHGGVASPRRAVNVLAQLVADRPGLDVVELENLPPEPLLGAGLADGGSGGIFIHRVRLVVETDFDGVLEYMGLIEDLPEGVYWESVRLQVPAWPTNRVEMVLYSVALDEGWVGT